MAIEELVAEILREPVANISDETSPETTRNWDSLRHIELVMAIEAAYDVKFSPAEIMAVSSLGTLRDLLRQKGQSV